MKLTIPVILITALIAAPAFAQGTNYTGSTSKPGASFEKDDSATPTTKRMKKHTMSHKKTHHAKHMNSKAQTTGSGGHQPALARTRTIQRPSRGSLVRRNRQEKEPQRSAALSF